MVSSNDSKYPTKKPFVVSSVLIFYKICLFFYVTHTEFVSWHVYIFRFSNSSVKLEIFNILFWKRLFAGTVPANKNLFAGTVPANKNLFAGTGSGK